MSWKSACMLALLTAACHGVASDREEPHQQDAAPGAGSIAVDQGAPRFVQMSVSVLGEGRVVSTPAGIDCTEGSCTAEFPSSTLVELHTIPEGGSNFVAWDGDCRGYDCALAGADAELTASFHAVDEVQWHNAAAWGHLSVDMQGKSLLLADEETSTISLREVSSGAELWTRSIPNLEGVRAIAEVPGERVLVVGQGQPVFEDEVLGSDPQSMYFALFSMADGQLQSAQVLADPRVPYILLDMMISPVGDIVVAGHFSSRYPLDLGGAKPLMSWWLGEFDDNGNHESNEGYLAAYSVTGEPTWQHRFGGMGGQYARNVTLGPQGNIFIEVPNSNRAYAEGDIHAGKTFLLNDEGFVFDTSSSLFMKFEPQGELAWMVEQPNDQWTLKKHIASLALEVGDEGDLYVAGHVVGAGSLSGLSIVNPTDGRATPFVAKLSGQNGTGLWSKVFATDLGGQFFELELLGDESFALSARFFGELIDSNIADPTTLAKVPYGGSFLGVYSQEGGEHRWSHLFADGLKSARADTRSILRADGNRLVLQGTSIGEVDLGDGNLSDSSGAFVLSLTH